MKISVSDSMGDLVVTVSIELPSGDDPRTPEDLVSEFSAPQFRCFQEHVCGALPALLDSARYAILECQIVAAKSHTPDV